MTKNDSNYIRRMKNHMIDFFGEKHDFKIGTIIGTNGYIWIYSPTASQLDKSQIIKVPSIKAVSRQERECMSLLRNSIICLQKEQLPIFKETIDLVLNQYQAIEGVYDLTPKSILDRGVVSIKHKEL